MFYLLYLLTYLLNWQFGWYIRNSSFKVHLMTSHELTSGCVFGQVGTGLRMAVMHPIPNLVQACSFKPDILTFPEIQYGCRGHFEFFGKWKLHVPACWQSDASARCHIWLNHLLYFIKSTHICTRRLFDDVTRINFRLIFSHADTSMTRCFSLNLVQIFLTVIEILAFYEIQDGCCRHLRFFWGELCDYPRRPIRRG